MRICITAQGKDLEAQVDPRFGRCAYFLIVETDTGSFEAIENANVTGMGGVGIKAGQLMNEKKVSAVLTGNVGPNAFRTLEAAGVEIFTGISGKASEAVDKFRAGRLSSSGGANVDPHFGMS